MAPNQAPRTQLGIEPSGRLVPYLSGGSDLASYLQIEERETPSGRGELDAGLGCPSRLCWSSSTSEQTLFGNTKLVVGEEPARSQVGYALELVHLGGSRKRSWSVIAGFTSGAFGTSEATFIPGASALPTSATRPTTARTSEAPIARFNPQPT